MKYMLLVYGAEDAWTEQEREECMQDSTQLCRDLAKDGVFLGASPLHSVNTATSVKIRESKRVITDGPFSETHEQLGGYYIIDVASLDDAINVAAKIPGATKGTVEIRPIVELPDLATIPTGAPQ